LSEQHFESFASAEGESEAPAELHALWHRLAEDWEDEAAHERFVQAAAREGGFALAARWYRRALRERGSDDPRAAAALERIRRMAEAAWLSRPRGEVPLAPGQPKAQPYRNLSLGLLALALRSDRAGPLRGNLVKPWCEVSGPCGIVIRNLTCFFVLQWPL
jgi:hypothetical protein